MKKFWRILVLVLVLLVGIYFLLKKDNIPFETLKAKYTTEASRFIDVNGLQVHYRIEGEGSPIVLIHGTGAVLQTWDVWTDSLKKTNSVIRLDIPAFGLTGARLDNDYSAKAYVKFLDDFVQKIGLDTAFDLAGNSLGGEIAALYAITYPHKVNHLVLLDPAGFYDDNKARKLSVFKLARIEWVSNLFAPLDPKFIVYKTLKDVFYDDSRIDRVFDTYYELILREGNREAFTRRIQQIAHEEPLNVSAIQNKTLLIWGKEDELLNISLADSFKAIPNLKYIVYENCGHSPQEEIPAQSVTDVLAFIQD